MIIYFSATGNSLYTARRLSDQGEQILSMTDLLRQKQFELKDAIQSRKQGNMMRRKAPEIFSDLMQSSYEKQRKTSHFTVKDSCIVCGKCK